MAEGSHEIDKKTECQMAIEYVSSKISSKFPNYPKFAAEFQKQCIEEAFEDIDILIEDVAEGFDESVILEALSNDIHIKDNDKESLCTTIHNTLSTFVPPRPEPYSFNLVDLETNYTQEDMNNMKNSVSIYAKLLQPNTAETSIYKVLIIGKRNNIPLLTYLTDTYQRFRLAVYFEQMQYAPKRKKDLEDDDYEVQELQLAQFCEQYCPSMKELRLCANNQVLVWYKAAMKSCTRRNGLFYCLSLIQQNTSKINDSLHTFCLYSIAVLKAVNYSVKECLIQFPTQIDVWIIPKDTTQYIFDDDDSDSNDDDDDNTFDLNERLKHCDNVQRIEIKAECDDINELMNVFIKCIQTVLEKRSRKRMVMIIDRRNEYKNDILYAYLPPNTQDIARRSDYLYESMVNLTKTEILPSIEGDINENTISGNNDFMNMFVLSLHLNGDRDVAMYWHYIGSCNRFCVIDMVTIWPSHFIANEEKRSISKKINSYMAYRNNKYHHFDQLLDINFMQFYQTNTKCYWSDTESSSFRAKSMKIIEKEHDIETLHMIQQNKEKERKHRQSLQQKHQLKLAQLVNSGSTYQMNVNNEYHEGDCKIDDNNIDNKQEIDDIDNKDCVEFIYQHNFDENGLLYFLGSCAKRKEYQNPCIARRVAVSVSSLSPDSKSQIHFVGRECVRCITKNEKSSWMCVDLKSIRIKLTQYTLKHHNSQNVALRNWTFEGSNDGNKWIILKNHVFDSSLQTPGDTKTWIIDTKSNDYFCKFRIFMTDINSSKRWYLGCSGIELYGKAYGGLVSESQLSNLDMEQKEREPKPTRISLKRVSSKMKDIEANAIKFKWNVYPKQSKKCVKKKSTVIWRKVHQFNSNETAEQFMFGSSIGIKNGISEFKIKYETQTDNKQCCDAVGIMTDVAQCRLGNRWITNTLEQDCVHGTRYIYYGGGKIYTISSSNDVVFDKHIENVALKWKSGQILTVRVRCIPDLNKKSFVCFFMDDEQISSAIPIKYYGNIMYYPVLSTQTDDAKFTLIQ